MTTLGRVAANLAPPGVESEKRREHDNRRTERDVDELPDAHVRARDPVEGTEQCGVHGRTKRRRVLVREREPRRDPIAVREGGGDRLVVVGVAAGLVVARERGQVDQPDAHGSGTEQRERPSRHPLRRHGG